MAKATTPDAIYEVAVAFSGPFGVYQVGELFRADHPLIKRHPEFFRPAVIHSVQSEPVTEPLVEQATAAPGEKRGR